MNDKPSNSKTAQDEARRSIIKRLVAGGGVFATSNLVPSKWAKPVVESVVLPAHAVVSPLLNTTATLGP